MLQGVRKQTPTESSNLKSKTKARSTIAANPHYPGPHNRCTSKSPPGKLKFLSPFLLVFIIFGDKGWQYIRGVKFTEQWSYLSFQTLAPGTRAWVLQPRPLRVITPCNLLMTGSQLGLIQNYTFLLSHFKFNFKRWLKWTGINHDLCSVG